MFAGTEYSTKHNCGNSSKAGAVIQNLLACNIFIIIIVNATTMGVINKL